MEYATQDLVAMVAEREGKSLEESMGVVYKSPFYEKLMDASTGLYLESSEYLYSLMSDQVWCSDS